MVSLEKTKRKLEKGADKATAWIGSTKSLILHTVVFATALILPTLGVHFDRVLLVLTTFLSIEAIYLAIFIQMTVNKTTEDIEEIQEDIEEIEKEHEEDYKIDRKNEEKELETLNDIQETLRKLFQEIESMKKK